MPKILAIDDINDNLISLKAIINETFSDSIVFTALNGPKGIELAIANDPDVILLDIIMPEMDGFEVCRLLKLEERTRDIPVVFLTALKGDKESRIKALEVGAEGFLSKPIDEVELIAQIRAMVKIKEANEQKRDEKGRLTKLVEERTNELVQSQAQLKSIFENLQDAYFQADLTGKFILVSPSALKMYGYQSIDELLGQPAEILYFNPKERHSLISILRTEGQIKDYVSQGRKSDGSAFWVSMNIQWLWSKDRQIIGTEGVVRDITERVEVESALKESQERFKHVFESANVGKSMTLPTGEINVNQAFCDMLGYTKEELKNKKWQDLTPVEEIESTQEIINSLLKGETNSVRFNKRYFHKNGSFVWADVSVALLRDQQGKPLHFITTVIDITERKVAEDALRMSEEKHRTLFEQASDGIFIADNRGNYMDVNSSGCIMLGYSREEILKFNIRDLVTADSLAKNELKINELKSDGILIAERELRCKDGSLLPVEVSGKMMPDGRYQGIVRDITERIKTEKALKESEEKYRIMVDLLPDAVIIHEGGKFVFANAAALKTVGADSFEQLIERPLMDYVHPDFRDISLNRIKEIYSTGQPSSVSEEKFITLKDEIVEVEVLGIPVLLSGKPAVQTIIRDITERKQTEKALQKSEAQFREFFEKAADAIFIAEIESGIIVDANEAASRLMLRPHEELVGIHQTELHPPVMKDYSKDTFKEQNEKVKNNLTSKAVENSVVRADGIEVPVEILASEVDYHGKRCMMGTFRDITDRKRASEALKNSLSLTESTLESIHNGILVVDHEGRVIKTSSRFADMWNIPESILASGDDNAMINYVLGQLMEPDEFVSKVRELYSNPDAESTDLVYFKDGRIFERVSKPMSLEGEPKGRVWSFLDITDRRRAENELHENVARLELAMSTANMSWWEMDMATGLVVFEKRKAEMLGYSPEKFKHYTDFMALVHPEDFERTMNAMRLHLNGSLDKYEVEYRIKTISGEYKWFYDIGSVTKRDSEGNPLIVSGLVLNITERKVGEELLRETNEFNQSLLKTIPFGMNIVDEYGNILFQNENFENVFGKNAIGGKCWDFCRDDRSQCPGCPLHMGIEIGETATYESAGVLGGRIFEISHTGMMFRGKKAMLEIFQDITERKRVEGALREREQLFRDLFNASPDAILLIDTNHPSISWPIVDCNEAACRMNGYTREEMIGQPIDLLHTNITTQEEHDAYFNNLKEEGILCRENVHRHKDGHSFPIETSNTILVIGGHQMLLGIDRDITDRKHAEVELLEKNTFIQTILDNLPIGLALNSIDNGSALYMNKKFEEIYGWPLTEVKDVSDFFYNVYPDENYRSELISTIMTDIQSGDTQRMHWENIIVTRKDGSKRVINAVNIPLVEQNTMVSTVSDITELHKSQVDLVAAKEKAEESDRLKSAFLANMSHEIRTPLNSIIGFSDLLFDPEFDEEQKKSFAENISLSGNGLLVIISDIMDLSKIETGQVKVHKSKFSINRVVSDIHREYVFQASKKGIEFLIDPLNPEDIFIESDEDKLRQVLINFVTNALKFTESGFIEVGIRDQGDCVYLQVKDTGIGIPEEYHDKVFERFRQVESAQSRKYGGNGLGLAISKSLIEMLGGDIGLESAQGSGSTFYFTIPKKT